MIWLPVTIKQLYIGGTLIIPLAKAELSGLSSNVTSILSRFLAGLYVVLTDRCIVQKISPNPSPPSFIFTAGKKKVTFTHQYNTSSSSSKSNLKCTNPMGLFSEFRAIKYQADASVISSLFCLSFQPQSPCSYLDKKVKGQIQYGNFYINCKGYSIKNVSGGGVSAYFFPNRPPPE